MLRRFCIHVGVLSCFLAASSSMGAIIAEFDFSQDASGNTPVLNLGIGPSGELLEGAVVADGVLNLENVDLGDVADPHGMDLPLAALNPFGGDSDWVISFDFATEDSAGPLFSSDSGDCSNGCNDAEQAGSINIFLNGAGEVIADAWFIGAIGSEGGLNDGEQHHVELAYTAEDSLWELFVDEELVEEATWEYLRDATGDRTRIGGLTNDDFGFEIDENMNGLEVQIDNFVIEAPSPPPVILNVDRDSGALTLESIVENELNFNSLAIGSDSGSLDAAAWTSIAGNYDATGDSSVAAADWTVDSNVAELLSEAGDGGKLAAEQQVDLGSGVWLASPLEDIEVRIFDTDLGEEVRGAVAYTGAPLLFADLNLDGELSGLDWVLFVDGFGQDLEGLTGRESYFLADLNVDGVHDAEDFIEFSIAFDTVNGAGAFAAMAAAVPEPASAAIFGLGSCLLLLLVRHVNRRGDRAASGLLSSACVCAVSFSFLAPECARGELLVEYTFSGNLQDSSGNGRDGELDEGIFGDGAPGIFDDMLDLSGAPGESMIVPLEAANPFDGSGDFTIDMSFTTELNADETGYLLISSADFLNPAEPDNHSMAVFLSDEGHLVYDNFFVGEVRYEGPDLRDEQQHQIRLTFEASDEEEGEGFLSMRIDGDWVATGPIAPNVPEIAGHEVRIGSSLNEEFPFDDGVSDFLGTIDDVRIYNEAFAPSQMRAEVDRSSGDIKLIGGQFARDIKYYEISSEAGSLDAAAWGNGNLDTQNVDPTGEGSGETWDALTGTSNRLVEAFLLGSTLLDDGRMLKLAGAFAGGEEDLDLQIVTTDNEVLNLSIDYVGEATACDAATQGDMDGNGSVDFDDFVILSNNFGSTSGVDHTSGDIDCNGAVDFDDFVILSNNFGSTVAAAASVPEPTVAPVFAFAIVFALAGRKRR